MRFWSGNAVTTKIKRQKPPCARRVGHEPDCPLNGEQVVCSHLHVRLHCSLLCCRHCSLLCCGHSRNPLVESKQRCRYLPEASFDRRCLLACCSCVIAQDAERPGCIRPRGLPCQWHRRPETSTSKRTVRNTVAKMDFLWEETQSREKNNFFWGFSSGPHIKSQAGI